MKEMKLDPSGQADVQDGMVFIDDILYCAESPDDLAEIYRNTLEEEAV